MAKSRTPHEPKPTERPLPPGITREQQPDGSYKWFTLDPDTQMRVEIDPEQAWFWTDEWQAGEREADEDLREGRYRISTDLNDLLRHD
jgi:hypothetical protein